MDDVKKLGKFIEIEKEAEIDDEKNEVYQECLNLLKKIDPEAIEKKRKYGDLIQDIINKEGKF